MNKIFIGISSTIAVFVLLGLFYSFTAKKKLSIDGNWMFVEIQNVKPNGTYTSTFPKESLAIFSENAYSFTWTAHVSKSRSWQITDSIKIARFNGSLINSGTFKLNDSIMTTNAIFAMHPMFTNGVAKFKCKFNGDTLILTGLSVTSVDNVSHPSYANGSHFVSKLLKVRNN